MATIDQATLYETFAQSVESYLLWDKLKAEPHQSGDNEGIIIGTETADTYEARKHMAGLWIVRNARSVAEAVQTLRLDPIPILAIANKVKNPDNGPPAVRAAWPDAKAILDAATILQERDKGQTPAAGAVDATAKSAAAAASKPGKAIFDDVKGVLVIDGATIALQLSEKCLLRILVSKGAATTSDLESACNRPDRVLKALLTKHAALKAHITLPGGPARGGYSTTIKPKKKRDTTCRK